MTLGDLKSYLLGAMHDGTIRRRTFRISEKEEEYVLRLRNLVLAKGIRAWTYREGKTRNLFVVEFGRALMDGHQIRTHGDVIHYVRGYFDAEGSVSNPVSTNPYVYFGQKDRGDLEELHGFLGRLNVHCGKIHNPSRRVDPDYWRFFVSRRSLRRFGTVVGSWHPRKGRWLGELMTRLRWGR